MACGEYGPGRMAEPLEIVAAIEAAIADGPLDGKRILVTSGPTHEPIDPVRYIANRSSGAQGTAIARALAALGAEVMFVTGPADVPPPEGVQVVQVQTAAADAGGGSGAPCRSMPRSLPPPSPIGAWPAPATSKMKKTKGGLPTLDFAENPDILAPCGADEKGPPRPCRGLCGRNR